MKNTVAEKKMREAIENAEAFIEQMQQWDDKKLEKHLNLFKQQMELAYKQKNDEAYQLLYLYERQVLEARVAKMTD